MVISSVNNFKTIQVINSGINSNKTNSCALPQVMSDTVEIGKKAPSAFKQTRRILAGLMLGAATLFTSVACTSPSTPVDKSTPTTPPVTTPPIVKTPIEQTQDAVGSTLGVLNPQVKAAPTGKFEGFSYDMNGRHHDFAVSGGDAVTGKLTINHVSMDMDMPSDKVIESLTLSKTTDGGFRMTNSSGSIQEFVSLGNFIQETDMKADGTNKLFYYLQKIINQGDVLFTDLKSHITTNIANFKIRK